MSEERSMISRMFLGAWHLVNGARKVFLNLLFLGFVVFVFVVMAAPKDTVRLQGETTLVLRPYGNVVEEYSSTPLDRIIQQATDQTNPETRLRDLVRAIEQASNDTRIKQLLIDTNYMWGIGLSSLLDIEKAIDGFKATGKPVVAMGDGMGQHQYYLASMADEVWLSPGGAVWIDGYANVRNYYREGLEKLEVEVNLFRVGEFKSAMEPFIRNDMSAEAKEASLFWMRSLWLQYLEGISRHRGVPIEVLSVALDDLPDRIEASGGDFAQFAVTTGLVDRLISRPEARQELALRGAPNKHGDGFRSIEVLDYLAIVDQANVLKPAGEIMVLVAEGNITSGRGGPGTIGADSTTTQLRKIGRKDHVRSVVLRINSPGGEAQASERIRQEIQVLRDAGKTVVVSMGNVAASGGYWIALGGDEIWASPSTITGSIGVFGMLPTFGATLGKIGIHTDGVGTTRLAGKLRLDRPLDPGVRKIFQASTENVYTQFLDLVATARGMTVEEVDEVARGRVWSGAQAVERGLVDKVGTLHDAIDSAARIAGLGSGYRVDWYESDMTPFERFMLEMSSGVVARMPSIRLDSYWIQQPFVQDLLEDLRIIAGNDGQFSIAAYCLCEVY